MAIDKWFAIKRKWRISETTLILISVFGGGVGGLIGMTVCRHKTNKPKFRYGVPVIVLLQYALLMWFVYAGVVKFSIQFI